MPGATVFVLCSVAYAWAGWRLARRLLGAHDGPHLPVLLLGAYVLTAALLVVVTAGLGGFGAVPLECSRRDHSELAAASPERFEPAARGESGEVLVIRLVR